MCECSVVQSWLTLCNPIDCSLLGSSVYEISQARILEWVATPFSRGSSWPRNRTWVSCIARRFFIVWTTREAIYIHIHVYIHRHTHSCTYIHTTLHAKWLQLCLTLVTPWTVACQALLVHGILQARILEWVAMPSSRRSSWPRDRVVYLYLYIKSYLFEL